MVSLNGKFSPSPTALGLVGRLACQRLETRKIDPRPLLRKCHLNIRDLNNKKRVSAAAQVEFLNESAIAADDDFIGASLAESYDLRELGMLYYVAASSRTLHDALRRLARYSRLANEGIFAREKRGAECTVEFVLHGVQRFRARHHVEFMAVTLMRLCRQMLGRKVFPQSASFVHYRPEEGNMLRAMLGPDVRFGALQDEVRLDPSLFEIQLVGQDCYLNELMAEICDEALANQRLASGSFRIAIENAIAPLLPHGEVSLKTISRHMGQSERTFHRRLVKENLRFSDILEDMRRRLAQEYLAEPSLQMSQIAWLLGFKSPSAFTHSCRKWFGMSPTRYRRSLQKD